MSQTLLRHKLARFRPTVDTKFHIDYDWWEKSGKNFRLYLRDQLCDECRDRFRDHQNTAHLMPVWPEGSIFNGTSVIFHQPGKADQPVVIGEEFVMSGQPVMWSGLSGQIYSPFQHQCSAAPFMVASVRPAD